jgi:hypothetical protein
MTEPGRWFQIFNTDTSPAAQTKKLEALAHVVVSLAQEVETQRRLLEERGVDPARYRAVREQVMLGDHGGPGAAPWRAYSYFKHTLDEEDFLRSVLGLDDAGIARFRANVKHREILT